MFQRLQWKLTAYYTCFTSLLGMIAVLGFLALVGALIVSPFTTQIASNIFISPLAEDIQPLLTAADRTERIETLLVEYDFVRSINFDLAEGIGDPETGDPTLTTLGGSEIDILVADARLEVVASLPAGEAGAQLSEVLDSSEQGLVNQAMALNGVFLNPILRDANGNETVFVPIREDGVTQGLIVLQYVNPLAEPGLFAGVVSILLVPLMLPVLCLSTIVGTLFGLVVARGIAIRLGKLATSAESWSTGDFSVSNSDKSRDEIGQLGRQLNGMAVELQGLMQSSGQLAMIEERNRIARDLHDSAKQQIFATTMQLSTAKVLMDINPEQAKQHIAEAEELAKAVQKELSGLIEELRPAQLEGQGLFAAVRSSAETFARQNNIKIDVRTTGDRELPLNVEQPMFRIFQETFNNIAKHSQATHVDVSLDATNESLTLRVKDNGVGFDQTDARTGGLGLRSMQERIAQMNGKIQVKSGLESGTTVTVSAPLAAYHLQEFERKSSGSS